MLTSEDINPSHDAQSEQTNTPCFHCLAVEALMYKVDSSLIWIYGYGEKMNLMMSVNKLNDVFLNT